MDVTFTSSDLDKDSLLNMDEYKGFLNRTKSNTEAKGLKAIDVTDERVQRSYEALN